MKRGSDAHRIGVARPAERHVEHLLDAAGARAHHRDAVAEQDRLVDRMGDEHHGLALIRPLHELQQLFLQDFAGLRVERGERLVHQQDRRVHGERAHEADALLHAAGELIGVMALEAGEADEIEIVRDALLDLCARRAGHRQPERGVVVDGLPRQQAEMLKHHGDAVRRTPGDRLAVDEDLTAAQIGEPRDAAQQRGLAATRRPDHAHDLVAPHLERQLVKRHHRAVEEKLARTLCYDRGLIRTIG